MKLSMTLGLLGLFVMVGCGAHQSYRLPVNAVRAPETFAPLASVASQKGHRVAEFDTSVHVEVEDGLWVYYTIQNDRYNMVIHLTDDEKLSPQQKQEKLALGKKAGDTIWKEAMVVYRESAPVVVEDRIVTEEKKKKNGITVGGVDIGF